MFKFFNYSREKLQNTSWVLEVEVLSYPEEIQTKMTVKGFTQEF